jgi:hypothetical protein
MSRELYYNPAGRSAYSTLSKLVAASKVASKPTRGTKSGDIRAWLLKQDAFTMHRTVRKRFPRNPYDVTNVMDVWECDVMDVQTISKYNDNYKYLLTVIDVFSKFLYIVPLRSKTGTAVASAFRSVSQNIHADVRSGCEQIGAKSF